jgi:deoxycytidylate deaminase
MTRPDWDSTWMKVAGQVAERSLCEGDQVGAVIVTETNRVVAVGYNNPPAGFVHGGTTCSYWCGNQAPRVPEGWEQDPKLMFTNHPRITEMTYESDRVIIEVDDTVRYSFRYDQPSMADGVRKIMKACGYRPMFPPRADSNVACPTLHAEANALSICDRTQREGGTLYVTSAPCFPCAKLVANSGLGRLVYLDSERGRERVQKSVMNPLDFMVECGIKVIVSGCIDCGDEAERRHPYVPTTEGSGGCPAAPGAVA